MGEWMGVGEHRMGEWVYWGGVGDGGEMKRKQNIKKKKKKQVRLDTMLGHHTSQLSSYTHHHENGVHEAEGS